MVDLIQTIRSKCRFFLASDQCLLLLHSWTTFPHPLKLSRHREYCSMIGYARPVSLSLSMPRVKGSKTDSPTFWLREVSSSTTNNLLSAAKWDNKECENKVLINLKENHKLLNHWVAEQIPTEWQRREVRLISTRLRECRHDLSAYSIEDKTLTRTFNNLEKKLQATLARVHGRGKSSVRLKQTSAYFQYC